MSGVIDEDGVQWERCNECGKWVRLERLVYAHPDEDHPYGQDLCHDCAEALMDDEAEWYAELNRGYSQDRI